MKDRLPMVHVTKSATDTTFDNCEFDRVDLITEGKRTKVLRSKFRSSIKSLRKDSLKVISFISGKVVLVGGIIGSIVLGFITYYGYSPTINVLPKDFSSNSSTSSIDLKIKKNQVLIPLSEVNVFTEYFIVPRKVNSGTILVCPEKSNSTFIFTDRLYLKTEENFSLDIQEQYPKLRQISNDIYGNSGVSSFLRVHVVYKKLFDGTEYFFDKLYLIFDENTLLDFDKSSVLSTVYEINKSGKPSKEFSPNELKQAIISSSIDPKGVGCPAFNINKGKWEIFNF